MLASMRWQYGAISLWRQENRGIRVPHCAALQAEAVAMVEAVVAHFSRLDILVNNAGMCQTGVSLGEGTLVQVPAEATLLNGLSHLRSSTGLLT